MSEWSFSKFVDRKIRTTVCLHKNCNGTYGDVVLILCASISAMASFVWPGRDIDCKRYVQLLIEFMPETCTISVPRLAAGLRHHGLISEENMIENRFHLRRNTGRIYVGSEIDMNETELLELIGSSTDLKNLRKYSYAFLLYSQIRCSYSHEFKSGHDTDPTPMTSRGETCVSYVNDMNAEYPYIHFGLDWLAGVCMHVAKAVDALKSPYSMPNQWWADGSKDGS